MSVTHITGSQTVTVNKDSEYYVVAIGPGGICSINTPISPPQIIHKNQHITNFNL